MSDVVVDTDVLSAGFRFDAIFADFYGPAIQGSRAVVSFMTVAELEFGMRNRNWGEPRMSALRAYVAQNYVEYGVTRRVCRCWADLVWEAKRQGRVLKTADAWIAATAVALGVPLVTHNARDFGYLGSLMVVTAPKP
ncbi:Ribonuclease VapC1 [Pirellulimonas nuda]|uniref:Ribonuclease VapC n=1 Tax=Pirellulimonas nuda TaxID=2528009 RepID=A0A518DJU9_9BACT|nr:PIN domain-containing protein [Pirellulimonas nuda]QDU91748.1 Ribonuclease VapC1 [Pirellulimonas nuda]